jgi:hypothetical protein
VLARTDTARLVAFVVQTQTTNPASWPALTSLAPLRGWISTQSCGVALGFGFGELDLEELGVGLGVAVELGVGVVVSGLDDPALEGEDAAAELDAADEPDVPGLDEGLSLADLPDDADVLAEADLLVLADLTRVADERADLNGLAEELASASADLWSAALFVAPESSALAGMSGHAAELMIE